MELHNYYQLLHIDKLADLETIKKAFRQEIAMYHPDKNSAPGARARFDQLVEGFDILSNPKKREAYDRLLNASETNKPVIIAPKEEEKQYKDWKKESKKKSDDYWRTSLTELLLLDIFLETGGGLFSGAGDILEDLGDSLGDIFDIF
ncbi:J domain-containing protein [uncultured Psychroserpens sp.]|uniref:J domain-containing protein n=1 Tax=uncultured Psychroserpens sp. TaxID=255436 RepID=UPI00260394FE|nr:J domain-containing protein [uncultured Psychroserpens sp.]